MRKPPVLFAVAFFLLSLFAYASGAGTARLTIAPESTLQLNGSSNVAGWRCSGTKMNGEMTVAAPLDKINEVIDHVEDGNVGVWMSNPSAGQFPAPQFELSIPIATLQCSGGSPMQRDMSRALKADRFPQIDFRFDSLEGPVVHDIDQHLFKSTIGGRLSLAGVARDLTVPVVAERLSRTRFRLRAELPVRMTDFAVAPPRALLGLIKANDALVVRFDLILEPAP